MPRPALVPVLLVAAGLAACGSSGKDVQPASSRTTGHAATTTTTAAAQDGAGCTQVTAPRPRGPGSLKKPALKLPAGKPASVTLQTNCGDIVIALDVKRAPKTAASFAGLVSNGFYNDLTFHRIVAGFVIQGGDPLGNGQGGPGYNVVEKPPASLHYKRGIVAMAKAQTDAAGESGSQFFIVTAHDAGLPPEYALVGKVTSGMDTVDKIESEPVNAQSAPLNPVVIAKATLGPPAS